MHSRDPGYNHPVRNMLSLAAAILLSLPMHAQSAATRLDGQRVSILSRHAKLAVLFFVATDCPISNRYQPEILRIQREFAAQGVVFWFVYPNLTDTPAAIRTHRADFAPLDGAAHVLLDPGLELVRQTGARITPEAAILVPTSTGKTLQTIYIGRIDDLYLSIGNSRQQATHHDLEDALSAALAGRPVQPPTGPPVGCSIVTVR